MSSISEKQGRRQAVPDAVCGMVVGMDISKGWIDWRACRPGQWGKRHHLRQDEAGFQKLEGQLQALVAEGQEVWVAMEPTGPYGQCVQEWLLARRWRVVLVNPYHVARTKEISDNSPRKDDEKDPGVIAELVWRGSYSLPRRVSGPYAQLRVGIREWFSLAKKHTAVSNEAQALLEVWFPEVERLFKTTLCQSVRALIRRYESPQAVLAKGKGRLRQALCSGTSGRCGRYAEPIWEAAQHSVAVIEGQQSRVRALRGLLDQLALLERRQEQLEGELAQWLGETPEAPYLRSVPELGVVTAAGLLGECGPLGDFPREAAIEKFVGLHLYRLSSGRRRGKLHVSKRGRSGARALLGQVAARFMLPRGLGSAWTQQQRARGKQGAEIETALARKVLRVLFALCRNGEYFDPVRWDAGAQTADGVPALQGTPMTV